MSATEMLSSAQFAGVPAAPLPWDRWPEPQITRFKPVAPPPQPKKWEWHQPPEWAHGE